MLKRYRADRAFDGFDAGQEVELDPSREWDARQIATGYLEELEDAPVDDDQAGAAGDESAPAETGPVDLSATTVADAPTATAEIEAPAPSHVKASRRKAAATSESDSAAGPVGDSGDSGQ